MAGEREICPQQCESLVLLCRIAEENSTQIEQRLKNKEEDKEVKELINMLKICGPTKRGCLTMIGLSSVSASFALLLCALSDCAELH